MCVYTNALFAHAAHFGRRSSAWNGGSSGLQWQEPKCVCIYMPTIARQQLRSSSNSSHLQMSVCSWSATVRQSRWTCNSGPYNKRDFIHGDFITPSRKVKEGGVLITTWITWSYFTKQDYVFLTMLKDPFPTGQYGERWRLRRWRACSVFWIHLDRSSAVICPND